MFRHTVEELFTAGLVKAVFATETLALGINMPARTVVLERLVKFNGEQHMPLTPGEYTQLTGRAGRRGIDVEGHAVVLWHPDVGTRRGRGAGVDPDVPAAQFVRAVLQHDDQPGAPDGARRRRTSCWNGPSRSTRPTGRWSGWCAASSAASGCSTRSPPNSAAATRRSSTTSGCAPTISERERAQSRASRLQRRQAANDALAALRRGDIITITHGRRGGLAVVLEPARDDDDPRPLVLTEHRWAGRISSADYSGASAPLGTMSLPKRVEHRQPRVRRDLASALRSAAAGLDVPSAQGPPKRAGRRSATSTPNWRRCASGCAAIPPITLPDREDKVACSPSDTCGSNATTTQIPQKVAAATNSLARTFDRIVVLLTERGFIPTATDERPQGHRRRPAAGPDLQRKRPAGRRVPARRRVGGAGRRRAGGGAVGGALRVPRRRDPAHRRAPTCRPASCAAR